MSEAERNKQVIRDLLEASDEGDLEKVLGFYSPDYVDHDPSETRDHPDSHLEGIRAGFQRFYELFPDTRHTLEDLVAEGDRVAARIAAEATHATEVFGIPASGRKFRNDSIVIYRLEEGRIVERWCRERRSTRQALIEARRSAGAASAGVDSRLRELGIDIPPPPSPVAAYVSYTEYRGLVFVAGQAPSVAGDYEVVGKVGGEITVERAQYAARLCALNLLAVLRQACGGRLDRVEKVLSIRGFVNAEEGFEQAPQVVDGASRLLLEVFGPEVGSHARTAIGCSALPSDVAVEVDGVFALREE